MTKIYLFGTNKDLKTLPDGVDGIFCEGNEGWMAVHLAEMFGPLAGYPLKDKRSILVGSLIFPRYKKCYDFECFLRSFDADYKRYFSADDALNEYSDYNPDFIFCDLHLDGEKERLEGLNFAKKIREFESKIGVNK